MTRTFVVLVLACLIAGAVAASASAQTVHVVGPSGFFGVFEAVAAAAEGDIILVEDGYLDLNAVLIDGKSLTLISAGSSTLNLNAFSGANPSLPTLEVRNLGAGQSVVVRGMIVTCQHPDFRTAVEVNHCDGAVVFEECTLMPRSGIGLHVSNSASVSVRAGTLSGGNGTFNVAGLRADDAAVHLYACAVVGGDGSAAEQPSPFLPPTPNGDGGDGAWIFGNSNIFASGVTFRGGDGGSPASFCFPGGDAGDGLVLGSGADAPVLRLRDSTFAAGTPSAGTCGNPAGAAGTAQIVASGSQVPLAGAARDVDVTAPVTVGSLVTLSLDGEPGDAALLLIAPDVAPAVGVKASTSLLHLALPLTVVALGALPGGDVTLSWTVPALPVGVQGLPVAVQGVFANGGQFVTSGPTIAVMLAP